MDFLIKIILFTLKIYFLQRKTPKYCKNPVFSIIFTFLSVIHQNYEHNLRIFANFRVKTQKSKDFAYSFSKNYRFFFRFFNKDYTFYTKNLFFTTKDAQSFVKISFFSNMFTFLSIIHKNFEYNLRNLANFRVKTQKSMDFAYNFSKNYSFLGGIILFTLENLFFTMKDAQNFVKISGLVTYLHF